MAFFQRILTQPIFLIFTILSLIQFVSGIRLAINIRQRWSEFISEPLQHWQKRAGDQAAILLAVPPGVIIHEFGHAVAVWLFGGRIVEFGYGFYWGYVVPEGTFSAAQNWFIALAGTLGTLLFGVVVWLILRTQRVSSIRYFGLRAFRFQVYFGLVYYPIFTALSFIGDWRTIYNFAETPELSAITAAVHAVLLAAFWYGDRRLDWFELPAFADEAAAARFQQAAERADANPGDERTQLEYITALQLSGKSREAEAALKAFINANPASGRAYLIQAGLQLHGSNRPTRKAKESVERALQLGLSEPGELARANAFLGEYALGVEEFKKARTYLDRALEYAVRLSGDQGAASHTYYFLRGIANRRLNDLMAAEADLTKALQLAQLRGAEQAAARYEEELRVIRRHSGNR